MTIFNPAHAAKCYEYFDDEWRTRIFQCPVCGWSGTHEEMDGPNLYRELFDCGCKNCDKMILIVSYPTGKQIIEAAANGNEHAQQELAIRFGEGRALEAYKKEIEAINRTLNFGNNSS